MINCTVLPDNYTTNGEFQLITASPTIQNWGYSPNQQFLIVIQQLSNNQLYIYNGRRNKFIKKLIINDQQQTDIGVRCFAFSKQSDLLVIGTKKGLIYAYNIDTQQSTILQNSLMKQDIRQNGYQNFIRSISISNDNIIAVGGQKKTVLFTFDKQNNKLELSKNIIFDNINIYSLSWASDPKDRLFIGGIGQNNGTFAMYQLSNNSTTQINTLKTYSVAALPTADLVLQGRLQDIINVIDISTKQSISTLANTNQSSRIIVSQNGEWISIQSGANKVSIWKQSTNTKQLNNNNNLRSLKAGTFTLVRSITSDEITMSSDGNEILLFTKTINTLPRLSLCINGKYLDTTSSQCKPCNLQKCLTCYSTDNKCQSCQIGSFFISQTCMKCSSTIYGCSKCNEDGSVCNECNTEQFWQQEPNNQGECYCMATYYKSPQNRCQKCSQQLHCLTCDSQTTCLTCQGQNFNQTAKNGVCECNLGYVLDNNECKACIDFIDGCQLCDNTQTCSKCNSQLDFDQQPNSQGQCLCKKKYYKNSKQCDLCSIHITDCSECTQNGDMCTVCDQNQNRNKRPNDQGECDCANFYYQNKKVCTLCDQYQKCISCSNTQTCNLCNDKNHWIKNQDNQCECMKGYYQDSNSCKQCIVIGCATCTADQQCDSCLEEKGFNYDPVNQTCLCKEKRYLDKQDKQCKLCVKGCEKCQQADVCQICDDKNDFEKNDQNKCVCKDGFYINEDDTKCLKCSTLPGCIQCTSGTACTKCNTTTHFIQDAVDGKCNCMDTYYKQPTSQSCLLCSSSISNCISCSYTTMLTCNVCETDYVLNSQRTKCQEEDGLSPLVVIAIIVGILALAGAAVAVVKCCKKRNSPLEDDQYQALEENK